MSYQSQPPQPTGDRWTNWATRLNTYLNRVRTQLQHRFGDESAETDGVLLYDPEIDHMVVSTNGVFEPLSYGENCNASFYTTATHDAASADTAYAITWENTALANDKITIADSPNTSRIVFGHTGTYQIDFSAELQSQNLLFKTIFIWPRINGTDIPFSTIVHSLRNANESAVVSRSGVFEVEEGDYLEAMFAVSNVNLWIEGTAATAFAPAAPSATIIVTEIR
jgi:hypothetical protein